MAKKHKKGKKKPKPQGSKDPGQTTKVDPQTKSLLFQRLPQKIRDHIWTQLFYSTRFTFGERTTGRIGRVKIKPAPNGLALLRTCRRVQLEIGESWLRRVLFCFEDIEAMLDKLSALPVETLSKLRHMRVSGDTLMLSYPDDDVYYRLASTLKLLPGLQLDQLTVLGGRGLQVNYDTLGGLIKDGNGWKTLRYICFSSAMLGFPSEHNISHPTVDWGAQPRYWRKPQPKHWQTVIEGRDGVTSNPSVAVYRAKEPALYGSIVDPSRRVTFEQKPYHGQDLRADVFPADPELMTGDEQKKELMVIVKRGSGVNYEEKKDSPFIESDIRRDLPDMTWKQIRALCIDNPFDNEDEEEGWPPCDEEDDPTEADIYKDVDEYIWTPLHYNLDL